MATLEVLRRLSILAAVTMAVAGPLAACGENETTAENTGAIEEEATETGALPEATGTAPDASTDTATGASDGSATGTDTGTTGTATTQ
ncbi:MAG TPA: hypothetical protein VED46_01015 [Alphaproteobacteria bacterium]|nr:hypothetical protein [Alphaproteobacteria bacterium]